MADSFYSVAIPEPTTVLGVRLRPFSLGHVILLHRIESSFVTPAKLTLEDLALSVLICSLTYKEGCNLFNRTDLDRFFVKWHRQLEGGWPVTLRLKKPRSINYREKADAFAEYIRRGSQVPHYSYQPADFKEMSCPPVQIVKVALMRDMGFSEAELLDRPWALCLWDFVTLKALSGQVAMTDRDEIAEAQKAADELQNRIKEGKWGS